MEKPERSPTLSAIISKLPDLDRGELDVLRVRVSAMLHVSSSVSETPNLGKRNGRAETDEAMQVLECIAETLTSLGHEHPNPGIMRKAKGYSSFKDKVPGLIHFLQSATREKREQVMILSFGIDLLYQNIASMGITISAVTIMNQIHRVPAVLNKAFPGYASEGTLAMMLIKDGDGRKVQHARPERYNSTKRDARRRETSEHS